ncbi:MAG TPA: LD-carboxypeptidase [bacterium]
MNFKTKPNRLTKGMTIGVISPASRPLDEAIYYRGIEYLKQLGYNVIESTHVLDRRGYLAGLDDDRAGDLNAMFRNPEIGAIFCSRGGYGTPRLIDKLDFDSIQNNPKIFVGYSDLTALSLAIWQKTGLVTFSGPMVAVEMGRGIDPFTENSFWMSVTSPHPVGLLANPDSSPVRIIKPGKSEGRLLGGCLSLINVLLGTPYSPDFDGAILIIEDIDEEPYRVDRYLAQLKLAGVFEKIAGIVLGQFIDCAPKDPEKPSLELDQIFLDYFGNLNIPIIANFAYGHGAIKHTIPIGIHAVLDTEQGGLILAESAVLEIIS